MPKKFLNKKKTQNTGHYNFYLIVRMAKDEQNMQMPLNSVFRHKIVLIE